MLLCLKAFWFEHTFLEHSRTLGNHRSRLKLSKLFERISIEEQLKFQAYYGIVNVTNDTIRSPKMKPQEILLAELKTKQEAYLPSPDERRATPLDEHTILVFQKVKRGGGIEDSILQESYLRNGKSGFKVKKEQKKGSKSC